MWDIYARVSGQPNLLVELLIPYTTILKSSAASINAMRFGKSGYIYVTDTGKNEGDILIHPSLSGKNLYSLFPELNGHLQKNVSRRQRRGVLFTQGHRPRRQSSFVQGHLSARKRLELGGNV